MAKLNIRDVDSINELLETTLPNDNILGYEVVAFKAGRGRYTPKTELLVVKHWSRIQRGSTKIEFSTFRIVREDLANSIQSLIKQ